MAESLRGRLIPLVLCCVSGGLAVQPLRALADALPPLQVDPSLLSPAPPRGLPIAKGESAIKGGTPDKLPSLNKAAAAVSGAFPVGAPIQDEKELSLPKLRSSQRIKPVPADGSPRPNFVSGNRIRTVNSDTTVVEQNAVLRRIGNTLQADKITYRRNEDEVEAEGSVYFTSDANVITGPSMHRKMDAATGSFDQPVYTLRPQPMPGQPMSTNVGYGQADRMDFEGENLYRLTNGTYTTCGPENPAWYTKSKNMLLNYNTSIADGKDTTVYFKDVPFLYSPWLDFPLDNNRKTGLLTPSIGNSTKSGVDIIVPWYWNIAPHMDATFTGHYMGLRGTQLNTEFRYLEPHSQGATRYDYLPKDAIFGSSRSSWSVLHTQNFGLGFSGALNLSGASDKQYFADLAGNIADSSLSYLTKQASLSYSGDWWNTTIGRVRYDPLLDAGATYKKPFYATLSASRPDFVWGTAFSLSGDFNNFALDNPASVQGKRTVLYPQISLPMVNSGVTVTPKIGYHVSKYDLAQVQKVGDPTSITRKVPIASIDANVTMERDITWGGKNLLQTLEPRLYYLRVPSVEQSKIPIFDSGIADFNFAQIFSENRYSSSDRIGDANQLTAALTSRIINPETGAELIRGAVGQLYYFRDQSVTLGGESPRTSRKTDVLTALNGQFLPYTWLDSGLQFNPRDRHTERFTIGVRYQPEFLKSLSASYRFRRDTDASLVTGGTPDGVRDFDVTGQWPLWGHWYGVGRYNYSLHNNKLVQAIGGIEYDGGCWLGRVVTQRYLATSLTSTAEATYSTAIFIQLELNGFSRIGPDPLESLKRNIAGYARPNERRNAPLYGVE